MPSKHDSTTKKWAAKLKSKKKSKVFIGSANPRNKAARKAAGM